MELSRRQVVQSALLATCAAVIAPAARARSFYWGTLSVSDAWAPPTAPGSTDAKVYMIIENKGFDIERLLSVRSPIARSANFIEEDQREGLVEQVSYIEVRPRRPVALRPGRVHVELHGMTQPLVKGNSFQLTLVFAFAGPVDVPIEIGER
ncbi:MAG: copper chaperone PCu(A)C [Alphaproteobacteria bacterium]|nr:copper chaperone PCu(A)C [Alphaproteobacteria bacterium]